MSINLGAGMYGGNFSCISTDQIKRIYRLIVINEDFNKVMGIDQLQNESRLLSRCPDFPALNSEILESQPILIAEDQHWAFPFYRTNRRKDGEKVSRSFSADWITALNWLAVHVSSVYTSLSWHKLPKSTA